MVLYRELVEKGRWDYLFDRATDYFYTDNLEEDPQLH
jgi:hypothetical protein